MNCNVTAVTKGKRFIIICLCWVLVAVVVDKLV